MKKNTSFLNKKSKKVSFFNQKLNGGEEQEEDEEDGVFDIKDSLKKASTKGKNKTSLDSIGKHSISENSYDDSSESSGENKENDYKSKKSQIGKLKEDEKMVRKLKRALTGRFSSFDEVENNNNIEEEEENDEDIELRSQIYDLIKMLQVQNQMNNIFSEKNKNLMDIITKLWNVIKNKENEYYKLRKEMPKEILKLLGDDEEERNSDRFVRGNKNISLKKFNKRNKTIFNVPRLGIIARNVIELNDSKHFGILLANKAKEQLMKNFRNTLQIKSVLKLITLLYDEKISSSKDNSMIRNQKMQIFAYNHFLGIYGMKKVAEQKYLVFLLSVKYYSGNFRVKTFGQIVNIMEDKINYTVDEVKKYLEGNL